MKSLKSKISTSARKLGLSPGKESTIGVDRSGSSSGSMLAAASAEEEEQQCLEQWGLSLAQERLLVQQLRDELLLETQLDSMWDDYVLRRFLRARKHHIPKAKVMFLEQLQWRAANAVDTVLEDFDFVEKEQFTRHYPEGFYGIDRAGRPVYVQQPGKVDTVELWKFTNLERSIRYHIQQQERYWRIIAPAASVAARIKFEQSLVVVDMDGKKQLSGSKTQPQTVQQQHHSPQRKQLMADSAHSLGALLSAQSADERMASAVEAAAAAVAAEGGGVGGGAGPHTPPGSGVQSPEEMPGEQCVPQPKRQQQLWQHPMQSMLIVDCEGVGISTLTGEIRKIMGSIMQIDQDYYPELMWKCVIINAPTTFRVIWGMIKYLMDARTQAKIEVLGVDYQSELQRLIDPSQLMQAYGGTNPAPLSAEPGPWQEAAVLLKLAEQQRETLGASVPLPTTMRTAAEALAAAQAAAAAAGGEQQGGAALLPAGAAAEPAELVDGAAAGEEGEELADGVRRQLALA